MEGTRILPPKMVGYIRVSRMGERDVEDESTITIAKPSNVARTAGIAVAVILALGIIAFPLVRRRRRTQPAPDKAVDAE